MQITTDELSRLLQHSIGSGLSLNSRCMLLWINAASFCVSLLTRDRERLSGMLSNTSSRAQIEEHCVSQLRHLWKFMRNNMQLTDEELSYLVMMCMRTNLQVCVHIGHIKKWPCRLLSFVLFLCFATVLDDLSRNYEWDF